MKFQTIIYLVVLLVLQACDDKHEPELEPADFLTVSIAVDHFLYDDMWIFASDETGKVLDAHSVEPGMTVSLRTLSPPEFVNLTVCHSGGSPMAHLFYTYTNIVTGQKITLKSEHNFGFLPPVEGKATISIQNCNPNTIFSLSDGHTYSQLPSMSTSINASLDLRQETSNILISSQKDIDTSVYGWVDNVSDTEAHTVDFNNLTPFPKNISVLVKDVVTGLIVGRKADGGSLGYIMTNASFDKTAAEPAVAKFGYLDGFDEYRVIIGSSNAHPTHARLTTYTKYGTSLPEEVTFPNNTLTIENSSIENFNFSYSSSYTYAKHTWRHDAADYTINWQVYTDKPITPPITELPQAFTTKYPSLSVNNLTYFRSDFYRYEDGYTYAQFLIDVFEGITASQHEFFTDSFQ